MGGNLLKTWGLEEKRLNRNDFFEVERKVQALLKGWFSASDCATFPIKSYGAKESFGDLDIVVGLQDLIPTSIIDRLARVGIRDHCLNGHVLSFPYEGFQVDLILVQLEGNNHDRALMAQDYFNYNDASNLIGIMAAKLGLSYGDRGLFVEVSERTLGFDNDNRIAKIELSHNPHEIRQFMGMDQPKWDRGFHHLEEIFEWITMSKWFNRDVYLLENANHKCRLRNRKRPTYNKFQEWLDNAIPNDRFVYKDDPEYYLDDILNSFPHVIPELDEIRSRLMRKSVIRKKFNGLVVTDLTGYTGHELGFFMKYLNSNMGDWNELVYMSPEKIKDWIMYWYNAYTKKTTLEMGITTSAGLIYNYDSSTNQLKFMGPSRNNCSLPPIIGDSISAV